MKKALTLLFIFIPFIVSAETINVRLTEARIRTFQQENWTEWSNSAPINGLVVVKDYTIQFYVGDSSIKYSLIKHLKHEIVENNSIDFYLCSDMNGGRCRLVIGVGENAIVFWIEYSDVEVMYKGFIE